MPSVKKKECMIPALRKHDRCRLPYSLAKTGCPINRTISWLFTWRYPVVCNYLNYGGQESFPKSMLHLLKALKVMIHGKLKSQFLFKIVRRY